MDGRTAGGLRDGLLAIIALGSLLDGLRRRGRIEALGSPAAAVAGVLGAVSVEAVMVRHPERTRELWERPSVQATSLVGTVVAGRSLARRSGARIAAALCWGLLVYLVLLAFVLSGRPNPLSALWVVERQ
jgi:hypothetical protein